VNPAICIGRPYYAQNRPKSEAKEPAGDHFGMRGLNQASWRRFARAFGEMTAERAFRKRVGNIGHLMAGNFGAGVVSFFAVALAARGLGVEQFGVLALISTFIQAIERFVSFQSWQPIIRYGAPLDDQGRRDDLKSVIKFGVFLDLGTALLGFAVAITLALVGAQRFGWSLEIIKSLFLYASALLFLITGSPTGVMRLAGRFREIAYFQVVSMTVRCALCGVALALGAGLFTFVAIWAFTHVLSAQLLVFTSLRELRRLECGDFLNASLKDLSARFPNIWRFSILSNFSLTIRSSAEQLDTLIVGALAGASGAGLYHIAKRIAKFAQQAGQQVQAVVFPDIARLWGAGEVDRFRKDVFRTEAIIVALCVLGVIATFLLADLVITLLAGDRYSGAGAMLKVQIVAVAAMLAGSVTRAALLCMGRETTVFIITAIGAALFFASAFALIPRLGAIGANYSHAIAGCFIVAAMWIAYRIAPMSAERRPLRTSTAPISDDNHGTP
jgi:O-antigen/teichoic acid export membrane protein